MFKKTAKKVLNKIARSASGGSSSQDTKELKILMGRILLNQIKSQEVKSLHDAEVKIFSQFGDDGIIQYLVNNVQIDNKSFVEFGVENYEEANTRFLLINNNWRGLIMDGSKENMEHVRRDPIYWQHELTARTAFVTAENINGLMREAGFSGDIGLLHIDIDGNDYWVWKAVTEVRPVIVIVEYNSVFGIDRAVTVPYDPAFQRTRAHYSNLFWGASFLSLCDLAESKGYYLVGSNSGGMNVYFVRKDRIGNLKRLSPAEGYVCSSYRESRDKKGRLTFISGKDRLALLKGMQVYNTRDNKMEKL